MKAFRRCSRILILWLLCVSVFVPVFLLSYRLKHTNDVSKDFVEDLSIIEEPHIKRVQHDQVSNARLRRKLDEKVQAMKDQLIRAKTYLSFTPSNSSSHFVKELKLRMKEVERAISHCTQDFRLSRSDMQRMKAMESTLFKARRIFPDCAAMIKKLRAMTYNAEEQVRSNRNQETFLRGLGGRTMPRGLHCLSMRLTAEYFALEPEERELSDKHKLQDPHLYHFAVFSDNVLACSVVVNSTISSAMGEGSIDPRFISELNHLRFYLPDVFPHLNKIVLLDHDVVVQRDLTRLWSINMRGKVNGAVETCKEGEISFRRMDMLVNFTDPIIANKFDPKTCTWAFGMNLFDLQEWRRQKITEVYLKYLHLGSGRRLWAAGSLPIGWVTFYEHTVALDSRWQVLGLGYDSGARQEDIDQASVLHFDGILKPWLDIGIERYKYLWRKHVKYEHPYLQQCNVHK
ncbi:UNVERIFIED_CONTAM: putative galacturonosyltransferase 6 [Sesamum angustifolium]|uniref:Hexosyltransferase n=1 Tax=Sesamum angustifolium TaxID=2727405 RepID=A0AAW2QV21_9LAMI